MPKTTEPPGLSEALGLTVYIVLRAGWWLLRHPVFTTAVTLTAAVYLRGDDLVAVGLFWVLIVTLLAGWWSIWPTSFGHQVTDRARARLRRTFIYSWRWAHAMTGSGLVVRYEEGRHLPRLVRVRSTRYVDVLAVRMLAGQAIEEWEHTAPTLAQTFGARACRVTNPRPGWVRLEFQRRDPLARVLPAPAPRAVVDLGAIPIGRQEDGQPWLLRLNGSHVLVAGATGAGKGSVIWSLICGLAIPVHTGTVQLWVCDPKGGMELAFGARMYHRFAYTPETIVQLLEDAAALISERAERLRGVTRQHTPTTDEPLVVIILDEAAFITAYMTDGPLARKARGALGIIYSQGRAVGVTCVAALQDPGKDVIPLRDLIPTRVALRLTEAVQADMTLGDGAHSRGAHCERIPAALPGVGYVIEDGAREPTRVRAYWVDDDDIRTIADTYPAPLYPDAIDTTAVEVEPVDSDETGELVPT